MSTSKPIAVIPARGSSKRIPKKNIIDFCGKPLIGWTIEAALESGSFDRVLVSTDSDEIAEVAKKCGAEIPFLRNDKSDDISPVSEATITALKQLKEKSGREYETVVQLMANCPLRDAADIRDALAKFESEQRRRQISCFKFGWMNPWWACTMDDGGRPQSIFHPKDPRQTRSQDLPKAYCPTGSIWIARTKALFESGSFYGPDLRYHELSWISAVDIDDYEDLEFARAAFQVKKARCS